MTMNQIAYACGFEDGLMNAVFRDDFATPQAAFAYRQGFKAGLKAAN